MNSRPSWINRFDVILLGVTALLSGLVSLLDFLGFLDGIPWLADRIPTLTLLVAGLVAGYLVLERRTQLENMHEGSRQRDARLIQSISDSTTTIIDSLEGVECRRFESGNDMLRYINKRLLQANQQIMDLSWSPALSPAKDLDITREMSAEHSERIGRVATKLPYREVFIFNRPGRTERLKRRIEEDLPGYSCAYYEESGVPLLQFMVIDGEEVCILSDQFTSKIAVRHRPLVRLFIEYYEAVWQNAIPIKLGKSVDRAVLQKVLENKGT